MTDRKIDRSQNPPGFYRFFRRAQPHIRAILVAGARRRPDPAVHQRRDGAVQGCIPGHRQAPLHPGGQLAEVHARGRQAQRPGRCGPGRYPPYLLRDAGQLVLRRLLQERGHRLGLAAADRCVGAAQEALWATCFKDEKGEIPTDEEAADDWREQPGFIPEHVLYFGRKDNFWEMAETGPCGPCSEIHIDRGPEVLR